MENQYVLMVIMVSFIIGTNLALAHSNAQHQTRMPEY